MSDVLLGLVGKDFVLIAADSGVSRSIVVYKDSEDKIIELSSNKLIGCAGPAADRVHFGEYIAKNVKLYELRSGGIPLSTHATAEFSRTQLAEALRKGPYQCNLLIGGVDKSIPGLYFCDYLASLHKVKFGAHGYSSYFALSMFDRYYVDDMNIEESMEVLRKIINELRLRFLLKVGNINCKIIDKDGIRNISLYKEENNEISSSSSINNQSSKEISVK